MRRIRPVMATLVALAGLAMVVAHADERHLRERWARMHAAKAASLRAFNEAKLGMFIHWGLYALPAGEWKGERQPGIAEWIMQRARIPRAEYARLAERFNPTDFDADEWVRIARSAGMRYMVITSKHHDGFALYDSAVSDYDVVDATPFGRDVVGELHAACRRQGLPFGVYYSHAIDWQDGGDGGYALSGGEGHAWPVNQHDPGPVSFPDYLERKAKPQVREILTRYPDLWVVWYDVPFRMPLETSFDFYEMTYELQPQALAGHRVGHDFGDYVVPGDNRIPDEGVTYDRPWETVGTMNNSWGYKHFDDDWKSVEELLYWIVEIASKGGNYMLNVGPTASGAIPAPSVARLREIGRWMEVNGEAIYGTTRWRTTREGPTRVPMKGTREREEEGFRVRFTPEDIWYTRKGETVYAIALAPAVEGRIVLPALPASAPERVRSVRLLGSGAPIEWSQGAKGLEVVSKGLGAERGYALAVELEPGTGEVRDPPPLPQGAAVEDPPPAASSPEEAEKTFEVRDELLLVPIRNGAEKAQVSLFVDGRRVRRFHAELAPSVADVSFWSYLDLRPFRGRRARIQVEGPAPGRVALLRQGNTYPGQEVLYREKYRPQFHFTSRRGWNNDPNGLVHYQGEWHLFYQHNPVGWSWDNMHWGHAVSDDLVHWRELGDALFPWSDARGHVFSGSGFVDWTNTSGFQQGSDPPLVVAYTDTEAGESLAFSHDRGRTFTVYEGNPVVEHEGRDPKVVWHEPTNRWVMAVYDETEGQSIVFYSSSDLREWRFESRLEGFFECPEILELPIDGGPEKRWVVFAADGEYVLGSFDGRVFRPEHEGKHKLWYGNFYASQVYSDAPDGRHVQIGWTRGNEYPGMPFNQGMTLPVELSLRGTTDGPRLFAQPVRELRSLRAARHSLLDVELRAGDNPLADMAAELMEIDTTWQMEREAAVRLTIGGAKIVADAEKGTLRCGEVEAPLFLDEDGRVRLQVYVDRGSIEVFAAEGRVALSEGVLLPTGDKDLVLSARGKARVVSFDLWSLRSIWPQTLPASRRARPRHSLSGTIGRRDYRAPQRVQLSERSFLMRPSRISSR